MWFEKIKKPILGLAPMHQVSRSELRIASRKSGADVVFSEMIASEAIIRRVPQALEMMKFSEAERPIIIQIFGNDPEVMAQAAEIVEKDFRPDGIDINFGCPVQKAKKQGFGSCQLKDPVSSARIIKTVKEKLKEIPLSIKIRIPQGDLDKTIEFVKRAKGAGIDMISIHGRTPTQKYGGEADWSFAYEIKKIFPDLIVLGNGDIKSVEDFYKKVQNLDGALIGRWAKNHPEIFGQIKKSKPPAPKA
jgi:tRNA-dihydrouridine synthase B